MSKISASVVIILGFSLLSCADSLPTGSTAQISKWSSENLIDESDPYWIAVPYPQYGIYDSLSVSYSTFGADPEAITDKEFGRVSSVVISGSEEVTYDSDGFEVDQATAAMIGGGGGGEEPEMMVATVGGCEDQYARMAKRCRRLLIRKARALCWGAAMVVYAYCRGHAE